MTNNPGSTPFILNQTTLKLSDQGLEYLCQYLWTESIELSDVQQATPAPGLEIYQGQGSMLDAECQIEAWVWSEGDQSLLVLCAQPSEIVSFGQSFPMMPSGEPLGTGEGGENPGASAIVSSTSGFFLRQVSLEKPVWVFLYSSVLSNGVDSPTSQEQADLQNQFQSLQPSESGSLWAQWATPLGLSFQTLVDEGINGLTMWGQLPPISQLQDFGDFLGADFAQTLIKAAIVYRDEFPILSLQTILIQPGSFGPFQLTQPSIEFSSPLYYSPDPSSVILRAGLKLTADTEIDFMVDFPLDGDLIAATGTATKIPFADASDLSELPSLQPKTAFELALTFSKATKTLDHIRFSILLENWSLVEGILTLEEILFSFSIFDPLGDKMVIAAIAAQATLGSRNTRLLCGGHYPSGHFFLGLDSETPLNITALIEDLGGQSEGIPDLEISALNAEYHLFSKNFSFLVEVSGTWEIITGIELNNLLFNIQKQETFYSSSIEAVVTIQEVTVQLIASYSQGWQFQGSTGPGQKILIGKILKNLFDADLPASIENLTVEDLLLSFNTVSKHFFFGCKVQFPIDDKELAMTLAIDISRQNGFNQTQFGGEITVGALLFTIAFSSDAQSKSFTATYLNTSDKPINIVTDLIEQISSSGGSGIDLSQFGLDKLNISELSLTIVTGPQKSYAFKGAIDWDTGIKLFGSDESLIIQAAIEIKKDTALSGIISGSLQTPLPLLENLKITVIYAFTKPSSQASGMSKVQEKQLTFQIVLGKLTLNAKYQSNETETTLDFDTEGSDISLGEMLTSLIALADPSIDEFQLDPPWNILDKIELSGFRLTIILPKDKSRGTEFKMSYQKNIKLGIFEITSIELTYKKPTKSGAQVPDRGLMVTIVGSVLGQKIPEWDALNESPPEVPGHGAAIFDLQYLGLGQHVSITNIENLTTITEIMTALRGSALPLLPAEKTQNPLTALAKRGSGAQPTTSIVFNAKSGIFIGAQMSLLKMLDLSLIFNDPLVYGLRIEMYGAAAQQFAGLKFEILYRKITDTIGVYHGELTLPDAMRQIQLGAVAITLPVVVLDIYTNGDFKIDVGFPWNGDWSRSAAAEVGIFTGAGGFYFNKLSAQTATSVPVISNGKFDPVFEFGLGLKIGLGRTFNKGPLKAELSITVQGIVQGVFAWFHPSDNSSKDQYYLIKGGVSIVGRLYGVVDFKVISVDIEVIARATILFVVEAYKPIYITLEAEVSVRASVKIVFVRIKFSFYLHISQSFTIGSAKPTPWVLASASGGAHFLAAPMPIPRFPLRTRWPRIQPQYFSPRLAENSTETQTGNEALAFSALSTELTSLKITLGSQPDKLSWQPLQVWQSKKNIDVFFIPGFTKSVDGVNGVALLFIENSIPIDEEHPFDSSGNDVYADAAQSTTTDFDYLLYGLLAWAIYAYYTLPADSPVSTDCTPITEATGGSDNFNELAITLDDLNDLYAAFVGETREDSNAPFDLDSLTCFLKTNYNFEITTATSDKSGTIFPMFPQLIMALQHKARVQAGDTLASISTSQSFSVEDLVEKNKETSGIISSQVTLISTASNATFKSLGSSLKTTLNTRNTFDAASLAEIFKSISDLLVSGQKLVTPSNTITESDKTTQVPAGEITISAGKTLTQIVDQYNQAHTDYDTALTVTKLIETNWETASILASNVALFATQSGETLDSLRGRVQTFFSLTTFSLTDLTAIIKDVTGFLVTDKTLLLSSEITENFSEEAECENLFIDYFKLLIRSTLQSAIDFVTDSGSGQITLETLLDSLNTGGQFTHIAAMTSRYLLHGVRVSSSNGTEPLYQATGQQFVLLKNDLEITLSETTDWISFSGATSDKLVYELDPQEEVAFIQALESLNPSAIETSSIQELSYYADEPMRFSLRHKTSWQSTMSNGQKDYSIVELPQDLQAYLSAKSPGVVNNLNLKSGGDSNTGSGDTLHIIDYDGTYAWGTKINITVRRIIGKDGNVLTNTYEMVGTSESGKDLLENVWTSNTTPTLYLLYLDPDAEGGACFVNPLKNSDIVLLKSNLSISSTLTSANMAGLKDFIKLLWESSSVTSGGFYLHLTADPGLPDSIFADGQNATLVMLASFESSSDAYSFNNCIFLHEDLDLDSNILLVENHVETTKVSSLQPGNLGIRYERDKPTLTGYQDELDNLYQLLNFEISATSFTLEQTEAIKPIGPLPDDPLTSSDDYLWIYERVVPVYTLVKQDGSSNSDLPPAELDPYLAIAFQASITFEFQWQDIYGNRSSNQGSQKEFSIRYTDPLVGINQWPSVAESYLFTKGDASKGQLEIELAFDPSTYNFVQGDDADFIHQKIEAALNTYQQIYYQLRSDVTVTIHSPMLSGTISVESKTLKDFAGDVYTFLSKRLAALEQVTTDGLVTSDNESASPIVLTQTSDFTRATYDAEFIFPVTMQMDIERDAALVDTSLTTDVPEIQKVSAYLSPKTRVSSNNGNEAASLRYFATHFEETFLGLHLAVSRERIQTGNGQTRGSSDQPSDKPVWAVHLVEKADKGVKGVYYNIRDELPYFFSLPPLATTMLSGEVTLDSYTPDGGLVSGGAGAQRFEAMDINVLARDFLAAMEGFLEPTTLALARQQKASEVVAILNYKKTLAEKISNQLDLILAQTHPTDISEQKQAAIEAYRQQLLTHLLDAYDIETVIQCNVDVEMEPTIQAAITKLAGTEPRLSGQPVATVAIQTIPPDFTLSAAKAPLKPGNSHLTFFFNTKSPEKFEENTKLDLSYRINEIEYDIAAIQGIANYQASSWLTFINPIDSPANDMGQIAIPVPLRTYPMPPSLVLHSAKADPDSVMNLGDIRQWQYVFTYEHLDVAQDAIESQVDFNVVMALEDQRITSTNSNTQHPLFAALINFTELYPEISKTLKQLESNSMDPDQVNHAIVAFKEIVRKVADAWGTIPQTGQQAGDATQYVISEKVNGALKSVTIEQNPNSSVNVDHIDFHLPGYGQLTKPVKVDNIWSIDFEEKTPEQAALDPVYGESSIPDRTLSIQDLDILNQQNAWGTIWLTRNKGLVSTMETNSKFVFQTPQVRFSSAVTPLLENNNHWDLGVIDSGTSLEKHIENIFSTILPSQSNRPYDIRVSCRYAFSVANGNGHHEELISTLPVVLGPRFTIRAGNALLDETESFRNNLALAINTWKTRFNPSTTNGMYIFSISLFKADDLTLIEGISSSHIDSLGGQKIKTFIDITNAKDATLSAVLGDSVDIAVVKEQAQILADSTGENINLPLIKINHLELRLGVN